MLFIDALWLPAGKGLTFWLSFVMSSCVTVTFPCGIPGHVWYLIVSIPNLCPLSYFDIKIHLPSRYILYLHLHTRSAAIENTLNNR